MSQTCAVSAEKLQRLEQMSQQVRIGGKGTARRKKKVVHKNTAADDRKLQAAMSKLKLNPISGIEEVNMYKTDNTVITFKNAKVEASPQINIFAVTGQGETKNIMDMLGPLAEKLNMKASAKELENLLPEVTGNFDLL